MLEIIRELLDPKRHRPRIHPNGFVQIDLNESGQTRLHIWPDPQVEMSWFPVQQTDHPVHDHKFDMRSTVLKGALTQETITPSLTAEPTHEIYTAQYTGSQTRNSVLTGTGVQVGNLVRTSQIVWPGMSYRQPARTFHETRWFTLTITLMEKLDFIDHEPRVLVPLGVEPDNEYNRWEVDEDTLWCYIWGSTGKQL